MNIYRKTIHGGDLLTCVQESGRQELLDFSANINPLGLPQGVRAALEGAADSSMRYPDPHCRELRRALSRYEGVPADWILCGNGAADLIYRIVYALRPSRAMLPAPTFAEYGEALEQCGCRVEHIMLSEENHFDLPESFADHISGADIVFLCNPNNPTGRLIPPAVLHSVLERCKHEGCIVVVDECFLDFLQDGESHTLKNHLELYPSLIILRAFTKIFAIPGLRLGYCLCASQELLARVEGAGPPWSVSVPAQLCGIAAVEEKKYLAQTQRFIVEEREFLTEGLLALGLKVYPAAANYLMFYTANPLLWQSLRKQGVVLRDCSNYPGLSPGYYRTAVRTRPENQVLLQTLAQCL